MKKSKKISLAGIILGTALTSSGAFASSGSCGAGKCGGEIPKKMEKKGSCGAGKCGGEMKSSVQTDEMSGNSGKKSDMASDDKAKNKKVEGSCGAGKCG